jgi:hypothetical protein
LFGIVQTNTCDRRRSARDLGAENFALANFSSMSEGIPAKFADHRHWAHGIKVARGEVMMTLIQDSSEYPESASCLRWIFVRRGRTVTCEIRVNGGQSYDVCVVPHWDVASSSIEAYDRPTDALRRHAEVAVQLHEAGWTRLSELSDSRHIAAA